MTPKGDTALDLVIAGGGPAGIMAGLLLRALGFGMLAWATNFPLLLLSAIFAALGGALFEAPSRAAVVMIARPEERSRYFAIESASSSIGTALGPLAGALLLSYSFELVALTSASFYVIACVMLLLNSSYTSTPFGLHTSLAQDFQASL